jgi:hypothetical protein
MAVRDGLDSRGSAVFRGSVDGPVVGRRHVVDRGQLLTRPARCIIGTGEVGSDGIDPLVIMSACTGTPLRHFMYCGIPTNRVRTRGTARADKD